MAGTNEILVRLSHDSAVLRLIEQNPDTGRLLWVNDSLEILEKEDNGPALTPVFALPAENEGNKPVSGEDEGLTKA